MAEQSNDSLTVSQFEAGFQLRGTEVEREKVRYVQPLHVANDMDFSHIYRPYDGQHSPERSEWTVHSLSLGGQLPRPSIHYVFYVIGDIEEAFIANIPGTVAGRRCTDGL